MNPVYDRKKDKHYLLNIYVLQKFTWDNDFTEYIVIIISYLILFVETIWTTCLLCNLLEITEDLCKGDIELIS